MDPLAILKQKYEALFRQQMNDINIMLSNKLIIPDHTNWSEDFEEKVLRAEKYQSVVSFLNDITGSSNNEQQDD